MTEPKLTEAERKRVLRHMATMAPGHALAGLIEDVEAILAARLAPVEAERDEARANHDRLAHENAALRQQVAAMEAKLPWPWSTVSIGHERVDTLTEAEQHVLSDAVHACDDDDSLDCACEPVYLVVGRILAALRRQVADLTAERDGHRASLWEQKFREAQSELGQVKQVVRELDARAEAAEREAAEVRYELGDALTTLAARDEVIARVRALADLWDSWDGSRPHDGESSPRQRDQLLAALDGPAQQPDEAAQQREEQY